MSKKEMWMLRNDLHETVFEFVRDTCHTVRELRMPSDDPHKRSHSGKIIGVLLNKEQGELLRDMIEEEISSINEKLKSAAIVAGFELPVVPIKYKIALVECLGDVMISKTAAQRRIGVTGEDLTKDIKDFIQYQRSKEKPDVDEIQKALEFLKTIDSNALYIDAVDTGTSYRINWFDSETQQRRQQSVGNIVIVVGEAATRIVDAPKRKARSDQAEQLYCYDRPIPYGCGDTVLHRIYPYDMRYVSRRKHKLDNK